jgi:hypothetical protein
MQFVDIFITLDCDGGEHAFSKATQTAKKYAIARV